jgi:hypothetical protein
VQTQTALAVSLALHARFELVQRLRHYVRAAACTSVLLLRGLPTLSRYACLIKLFGIRTPRMAKPRA